jgi:hypothetical protein
MFTRTTGRTKWRPTARPRSPKRRSSARPRTPSAPAEARWSDGLVPTEVDEQPDFIWHNPRVSERTDLENGRQVYTILCDDGQDVELKALIAKLNKKLAKWGQTIDIVSPRKRCSSSTGFCGRVAASVTEQSTRPEVISASRAGGDEARTVRQVCSPSRALPSPARRPS